MLLFSFRNKVTAPLYLYLSPPLEEGACNYPPKVIDYNLIEHVYIIFCFTSLNI